MDAPTGTLIAYSTAPGDVAADGADRNGTYTKHLLEQILKPLPVETMFKRVRQGVVRDTNKQQIPWESSSLIGDFYFNRHASHASGEVVSAVPKPEWRRNRRVWGHWTIRRKSRDGA